MGQLARGNHFATAVREPRRIERVNARRHRVVDERIHARIEQAERRIDSQIVVDDPERFHLQAIEYAETDIIDSRTAAGQIGRPAGDLHIVILSQEKSSVFKRSEPSRTSVFAPSSKLVTYSGSNAGMGSGNPSGKRLAKPPSRKPVAYVP